MINEVYRIGSFITDEKRFWTTHQQDRVYSIDGISPCISVGGGVPLILIDNEQ